MVEVESKWAMKGDRGHKLEIWRLRYHVGTKETPSIEEKFIISIIQEGSKPLYELQEGLRALYE